MVLPSSELVLCEAFDYPDGSVTTNSGSLWNRHSGTFGQMRVNGGVLKMLSGQTEDVNAQLVGAPYATNSGKTLFASFSVNFTTTPSVSGEYFAHFMDVGGNFRARVFGTTSNAPSGSFRLGIANNSSSLSNAIIHEANLSKDSIHTVVISYNVSTGISTLWVDPTPESSPSVTASDTPAPSAIGSFAFRENGGIGNLSVDDLKIGLTYASVTGGAAPQPYLRINRTATGVEVSWPAGATDAGFAIQTSATLGASADWHAPAQGTVRQGENDIIRITSPAANAFFRLRK